MGSDTLHGRLDNDGMASTQWALIGLCMLFNVIDGLDAMALAFTAGSVASEWALSSSGLGLLLSASLIGMAAGSMFAAPLADRYGRRPLLLGSLLLSAFAMLLSFNSHGPCSLGILRAVTGVGVGTILVGANVLSHEHARPRWRSLAIALQSIGFAIGAMLGGLLTHVFNDGAGWRHVFLVAGLMTLVAALAAGVWLRESDDFLDFRQRLPTAALPPDSPAVARTVALACAFFLVMFCFYFVMSWTPALLMQIGFSAQHGVAGGLLLNVGGLFGALLMGLAANRLGGRRLLLGFALLNALLMTLMVPATQHLGLAILTGLLIGLLLNGAVAGLYTLAPQAFATGGRARGVGLVIGVGRAGAILSPIVAGILLDAGWSTQGLFSFYAASLAIAALVIWRGGRTA